MILNTPVTPSGGLISDARIPTLAELFSEIRRGNQHPHSTVGFYDRRRREFRCEKYSEFFQRAASISMLLRRAGATNRSHVIVAGSTPEAVLLSFVGAVLLGAIPAVIANRPAFDSAEVVLERIRSTQRLLTADGRVLVLCDTDSSCAALAESVVFDPSGLSTPATVDTPTLGLDDICHVQLTSGSTGAAKGIALSSRNVLDNCHAMATRRQIDTPDVILSWLPLYHDMGLVGNALLAMTTGASLYLMSPFDFLADPVGWLEAIATTRATVIYSPSSSYELALDRALKEQTRTLDLSSIRYACCGAEPVRASVADRFIETFMPAGLARDVFAPSYGLAELTLGVAIPEPHSPFCAITLDREAASKLGPLIQLDAPFDQNSSSLRVMSVGRPLDGLEVTLLATDGSTVTSDLQCGEILVSGSSVAVGELTGGGQMTLFHGRCRTGDVGFWSEGNLFILDRLKSVIIRNGENYSSQIVEQRVAQLLGVSPESVLVIDRDLVAADNLTVVAEVDRRANIEALLDTITAASQTFQPPIDSVVLVPRGRLPKTTSGKKRHSAAREQLRTGEVTLLAERSFASARGRVANPQPAELAEEQSSVETKVVIELIASRMRIRDLRIAFEGQSRLKDDLGFDSLAMLELAVTLEERLSVVLPQLEVAKVETVADLINLVSMIRSSAPIVVEGITDIIRRLEASIPQMYVTGTEQREREVLVDGRWVADFASCNYLSLDLHPHVISSIRPMLDKWGVHPSWTRAVASPLPYLQLESKLAALMGSSGTVVFPTVSLLHLGVLPVLAGLDGGVIIDSAAHHSMQEAALLCGAKGARVATFQHGNRGQLERHLQAFSDQSSRIIVVDGIYSMSGAHAELLEYQRLAIKYDAQLYIDDAHGFGVLGSNPTASVPYGHGGGGIMRYLDMTFENVIYVAGMSKAFSSMAAFVTCSDSLQRHRIERASTMIFGGPIPVASLASALAGLQVNELEGDEIRARLWALSNRLLAGVRSLGFLVESTSFPIVNVTLGDPDLVVRSCELLWENCVLMTPSVFPAMPIDRGGVRFTITSANTEEQVDRVLITLAEIRSWQAATGTPRLTPL